MKLLVYGTLKQGHMNHERFSMDEQEFLTKGSISEFALVQPAGFPFPFLIPEVGGTVVGEVYEVTDTLMGILDRMEKGAGYKRIETKLNDSDEMVQVYVEASGKTYPNLKRFEEF
jgi:gamma-glutamylcyclotransferase (GGCT)/AIG2-like uncharacterized protein YtfP